MGSRAIAERKPFGRDLADRWDSLNEFQKGLAQAIISLESSAHNYRITKKRHRANMIWNEATLLRERMPE